VSSCKSSCLLLLPLLLSPTDSVLALWLLSCAVTWLLLLLLWMLPVKAADRVREHNTRVKMHACTVPGRHII
jgi:hypothetical protein